MITSPDAVYVIIPCMKELGMSWSEIKATPRQELMGLLGAMSNYNQLHQFDGYSSEDIGNLSKAFFVHISRYFLRLIFSKAAFTEW